MLLRSVLVQDPLTGLAIQCHRILNPEISRMELVVRKIAESVSQFQFKGVQLRL